MGGILGSGVLRGTDAGPTGDVGNRILLTTDVRSGVGGGQGERLPERWGAGGEGKGDQAGSGPRPFLWIAAPNSSAC